MFQFLLGLLPDFLKAYLGIKIDTAESLGRSEEDENLQKSNVVLLNKEAEAQAQAPTTMEKLIAEQKKGDI